MLDPVEVKLEQDLGRERLRLERSRLEKSKSDTANEVIEGYTPVQRCLASVLDSSIFEAFIGLIIASNVILVAFDTDAAASCRSEGERCSTPELDISNALCLAIYTLEAAARLYDHRRRILQSRHDTFDVVVVVCCYVDVLTSEMLTSDLSGVWQILRIFRISKVFRAARILMVFPEIYVMLQGFLSAMSAMLWGCTMILLILFLWSIVAVDFLQPVSLQLFEEGSFCYTSFNSVWDMTLLFFQTLVAGDAWGQCSLDIIKAAPASILIFAPALFMIQIGLTNLILAVVVEKAAEAHEVDVERKLRKVAADRKKAEERLSELCGLIDENCDGVISLEELMDYYNNHQELRNVMMTLDIREQDLENVFNLMDRDGSGDLTYSEVVQCISRADTNDLKRHIMMLKLQMQDVWTRIRGQIQVSVASMSKNMDAVKQDVESIVSGSFNYKPVQSHDARMQSRLPNAPIQQPGGLASSQDSAVRFVHHEMDRAGCTPYVDLDQLASRVQQQLRSDFQRQLGPEEKEGKQIEAQEEWDKVSSDRLAQSKTQPPGDLLEHVRKLCEEIILAVSKVSYGPDDNIVQQSKSAGTVTPLDMTPSSLPAPASQQPTQSNWRL
eukprot:TRINITY_DN96023_c0_g1_i1.p1 TRINITY_DN96023_c0_g1~~TRINITY_DN96023_c0_g1_i1.p1  ORF type:complete len:623 (+),score=131.26 TRINITY_DN96023_c0_g1_i1:37-1869(+)